VTDSAQETKAPVDNFFIDGLIEFEKENRKNYIVGRNNNFSYYFTLMLDYFAVNGGFDLIVDSLACTETTENSTRPTPDLLNNALHILIMSAKNFHLEYIKIIANKIWKNMFIYISNLSQNEMRILRKETIEVMIKAICFFSKFVDEKDAKQASSNNFSFCFAMQMIKNGSLDKKILGEKILTNIFKNNETFTKENIQAFEQNSIFSELFSNTHLQIVSKSKDLLSILIKCDLLNAKEYEILWGLTRKGDIELKNVMLSIFQDLCRELKFSKKHISFLLEKLFQLKMNEILCEEIDVITLLF